MIFTLGTNIKVGHKIKTSCGWRKVKELTAEGVLVKEGIIKFGDILYGWKRE